MFRERFKSHNLFPDIHLKGERIFMRPPLLEDQAIWAGVRARNQGHIQPFEPTWSAHFMRADFWARRLERQQREWDLGLANAFLIFTHDGALVGGVNINNICRGAAQFASIGYWLDEGHEGQGYMAEALGLTLAYCFGELGLHRVNASCLVHNLRSQKTLLRAGFLEEGFAGRYLQIDGVWQDHILYGIVIENWR